MRRLVRHAWRIKSSKFDKHAISNNLQKVTAIRPLFQKSAGGDTRNYDDAIRALNTLQSNAAFLDNLRASGLQAHMERSIPEMVEWCQRIGIVPSDLDRLNAIHIAGTKGKGSTAAFVTSILKQYTEVEADCPPGRDSAISIKLGLYISPHLRFVRERIQVNGSPLSEQAFKEYFFDVWDRLERSIQASSLPDNSPKRPMYFRYLTLMAFHAFLKLGVNTAVIECGMGGEYDTTNILHQPSVTAITSLGIDHQPQLGETIDKIAWHKAGIMKPGVPLFTSPQPEAAMRILHQRAVKKGAQLEIVETHPDIASGKVKLGLEGGHQKSNASLAIALAGFHLRHMGYQSVGTETLNDKFINGLRNVQWGGRCETREEKSTGITWYLDGAHTLESVEAASQWFAQSVHDRSEKASKSGKKIIRALIFNQPTRPGAPFLQKLHEIISSQTGITNIFKHAIFCTNITFTDTGYRPDLLDKYTSTKSDSNLDMQNNNAHTWRSIDEETTVHVLKSIDHAVQALRYLSAEAGGNEQVHFQVFVVGSLHLIGGITEVLEGAAGQQ